MTSRERVINTLTFQNFNDRVPRDLWTLQWAEIHHPVEFAEIQNAFEWDIERPPNILKDEPVTKGTPCALGEFVDEWGCVFTTAEEGIIGEVKTPPVRDEDWDDAALVHIPDELLTFDPDAANRFCAESDRFVMAPCCPRPFERLQFIRGTADLYMDLLIRPPKMMEFIKRMHEHDCMLFEKWAKTDVDGLMFMDDWGSQNALLINPDLWVELFKPMYKDLIDIARAHGKKTFMHSDGNTLAIIPHLIELGLDALNAQIFCIGIKNLGQFKGHLTFWGEIDRQHLLPTGTLKDIDAAVDLVFETLWQNGGCIAQCEFGLMGRPENVRRVYERWSQKRGMNIR